MDDLGTTLALASIAADGSFATHDCDAPMISANGRFVVFHTLSQLSPADTNSLVDVYIRDLQNNLTERVSVSTDELPADADAMFARVSGNGRFVVFHSEAGNLVPQASPGIGRVYVRDRTNGTTVCASLDSTGTPVSALPDFHIEPNGRFVGFVSSDAALTGGVELGYPLVHIHDLVSGTTTLGSVALGGGLPNGAAQQPWLSDDAAHLVYVSAATNIVEGGTESLNKVYFVDRTTGSNDLMSRNQAGETGNDAHANPCIGGDGRNVTFSTSATNYFAGDTEVIDIILRERVPDRVRRGTPALNGAYADADCGATDRGSMLSRNGLSLVFESGAANLTSSDTNGLVDVYRRFIAICFVPTVSISSVSDTRVCLGSELTLGASAVGEAPLVLEWTKDGVPVVDPIDPGGPLLRVLEVSPSDAGTYVARASNPCGLGTSAGVSIIIEDYILPLPAALNLCVGGSASLYCEPQGVGPYTYRWYKNGQPTIQTTRGISFTQASADDVGEYSCLVTTPCGSIFSTSTLVSVVERRPELVQGLTDVVLCPGDSHQFTAVFDVPSGPIRYDWDTPRGQVETSTPSLTIDDATTLDVGQYRVVAVNACGNAVTESVSLTFSSAPTISRSPTSQSRCLNESVTFEIRVSGPRPMTYQWFHSGTPISGATEPYHQISRVTSASAGLYWCDVTSGCGTRRSAAATLTVNGCAGQPTPYYVRLLDGVVPDNQSSARGLNNLGTVVGTYQTPGFTAALPIRWDEGGSRVDLGPDSRVNAFAINDAEREVGFKRDSVTDPARAAYRDGSQPLRTLDHLFDWTPSSSTALDVNAAGEMVVTASSASGDVHRPYVFREPDTLEELSSLPGMLFFSASSIDDLGRCAGSLARIAPGFPRLPVVWNDATPELLALPAGSEDGEAKDLSGRWVVGAVDEFRTPVVWEYGNPRLLSTPPGTRRGAAERVNASGLMVGSVEMLTGQLEPILWRGDVRVSLNEVAQLPATWRLHYPSGISDSGWICGDARGPGGFPKAFVLLPYEYDIFIGGAPPTRSGSAAEFFVLTRNAASTRYQWYRAGGPLQNGDRISGATSYRLRIDPVQSGDAGEYHCMAVCDGVTYQSISKSFEVLPGPGCTGDADADGDIDLADLATVLVNFGLPEGATRGQGDFDGDGDVDLADLASLLVVFGGSC
ncbi:MAG: immunoglobulin domain-containing protein [Phycisphaerae bacterium]